ncbi:MAG: twin-arginine translocase TatA/TatE family subunit [Actinomycetota bacterium]
MLNVGPLELLVVLAVALIVVGPERLPELARSVGRVLRQFRDVQDEVRDMVASGVDDDIREAAADFRKVTGNITRATDVKGAVRRAERTIRDEAGVPRKPHPRSAPEEPGAGPSPAPEDHEPPEETLEPGEVAGPPADRLLGDAGSAAEPDTSEDPGRPETEGRPGP